MFFFVLCRTRTNKNFFLFWTQEKSTEIFRFKISSMPRRAQKILLLEKKNSRFSNNNPISLFSAFFFRWNWIRCAIRETKWQTDTRFYWRWSVLDECKCWTEWNILLSIHFLLYNKRKKVKLFSFSLRLWLLFSCERIHCGCH